MPDFEQQIEDLTEAIRSGVTSMEVDGIKSTTDLQVLQAERRDLISQDEVRRGDRPRVSRVNLSGFLG